MSTKRCATHGYYDAGQWSGDPCPVCDDSQNGDGNFQAWSLYSVAQLKQTAKDWGLTGYSNFDKAELVELIEAADDETTD